MNHSPRQQPELDRLMLIAQNETCLFAYWQLSERTKRMTELLEGVHWSRLSHTLRLYDVTGLKQVGCTSRQFRDICAGGRLSRYIRNASPGHSYIADIGYLCGDGQLVALCRSTAVRMPGAMRDLNGMKEISGAADCSLMLPNEFNQFSAYTIYSTQAEELNVTDLGWRNP